MWTAFGRSVNTYFAWLTERVGADRVVEMAERLGIVLRAEDDAQLARHGAREWGPFTLGVAATTPLDLAGAYATVAAEGTWCAPTPITSITDANGRRVTAGQPDCRQVLDVDVARAAADAARCPVGDQSMYRRLRGRHGHAAAQPARPAGGRQDRQFRAVRHGDRGGLHPAAGGRRDRGEPGRPPRRGRSGGADARWWSRWGGSSPSRCGTSRYATSCRRAIGRRGGPPGNVPASDAPVSGEVSRSAGDQASHGLRSGVS